MTRFCIRKRSRTGAAIVALLAAVGFTCGLASAQAKQRPANQPALEAQVNEAFGLRDSTIVTLALPDAPGRPFAVGIQLKGQDYTLDLQPHSVRAENFVCYEVLPDRTMVEVDPGPERTLRGTVREDGGSIVAASLLEDGLYATMRFANGDQYWMEPLAGRVAGAAPGSYVIYNSDDVLEHGGVCGNPDRPGNFAEDVLDDDGPLASGGSPDCITQLACDADFLYFQDWGSISNVASRIGSVINSMNIQYEIEVDITHVITALVVRTTAASDPYTTTDAFDLVCQLGNYWDANMGMVNRDTVQLFTGRNIDDGTIGRAATFGGICDPDACGFFPCDDCGGFPGEAAGHYSFVQSDFNNNFGCANDLSVHELGHLWNAMHCDCLGCTMHTPIQCANTFCGPGVAATIIAFRNSVTCLDCTGGASFCGDSQAGICYTSNTSPYCDDPVCCETVCAVDPSCCEALWDQTCANRALDLCGSCGDPAAGDCFISNGNPGCDDGDCCAIICMFDNFCCDFLWDAICADEAAEFCEPPPPSVLIWFDNRADFEAFNAGEGKVFKGIENFEEAVLNPGESIGVDDPLVSGVANPPVFPVGLTGLPNLQVQSNLSGGDPVNPNPRGVNGLAAHAAPSGNHVTDVIIANFFVDSLDLIILADDKTGIGGNTIRFSAPGTVEMRVYDINNNFLGMMTAPADPAGTNFLGVWSPIPIGRINLFSPGISAEGLDNIQAWQEGNPCPADLVVDGAVDVKDLLFLLGAWGPCPPKGECPADLVVDGAVDVKDLLFLLGAWGPCP